MSELPLPPDVEQTNARGPDRRQRSFYALWAGNFLRRRRGDRRSGAQSFTSTDWHHPQWLAVAVIILLLCSLDAVLTLSLLAHGAEEINPLMRLFVNGDARVFALVKVAITAGSVTALILLASSRAFGRWPVWPVLYFALGGYVVLIGYELWLVEQLQVEILPIVG